MRNYFDFRYPVYFKLEDCWCCGCEASNINEMSLSNANDSKL